MAQTEASQIANYKGVMLCNRPQHGPAPRPKVQAFVSRVDVKQPIGTNPPVQYRPPPQRNPPKEILLRHRQWLQQVQAKKEETAQQVLQEALQQEDRAKHLADITAKQRKFLMKHPSPEQVKKAFNTEPVKRLIETFDKPKWALTQEEAEQKEEKEVDELLEYVNELDLDKYMQDLEVQATLEVLQTRIATLIEDQKTKVGEVSGAEQAKEPAKEAVREAEGRERALERPAMVNEAWNASIKAGDVSKDTTRIARALAEKILKANPSLRSVHSNQSIRQLMGSVPQQAS
jgi:hypothetical protein